MSTLVGGLGTRYLVQICRSEAGKGMAQLFLSDGSCGWRRFVVLVNQVLAARSVAILALSAWPNTGPHGRGSLVPLKQDSCARRKPRR